MKVGVIGHVLPLRHPIQTAEEFAQIDVLSGGRFIGGIVRGVPQEYVSFNVDPFTSRDRFAETYDISMKCLTEELFDYKGKFYDLKSVSVWPRPLQKPFPIWMPAGCRRDHRVCGTAAYPDRQDVEPDGGVPGRLRVLQRGRQKSALAGSRGRSTASVALPSRGGDHRAGH